MRLVKEWRSSVKILAKTNRRKTKIISFCSSGGARLNFFTDKELEKRIFGESCVGDISVYSSSVTEGEKLFEIFEQSKDWDCFEDDDYSNIGIVYTHLDWETKFPWNSHRFVVRVKRKKFKSLVKFIREKKFGKDYTVIYTSGIRRYILR